MQNVIIVGGGLSGLVTARRLRKLAPGLGVTVLESTSRAGGLIATETDDSFVIELGPESIITDKPWALQLAEELGLASEIINTETAHRGAYVVRSGRLMRIPFGFSLVAPSDVAAFAKSPVLTARGRVRALLDVILPRRRSTDDESLKSFVERRFGRELLERLAQPMLSGIYGADPERLSMKASAPRFLELEQRHRSVILGLRKSEGSRTATGARYGLFISFRRGLQTLTDALLASVESSVTYRTRVSRLSRDANDQWRVHTSDGESRTADAVVLATPAHVAATLVTSFAAPLARELETIRYGSTAIVTYAFRREEVEHPLDAFGFVVPQVEKTPVIAATFSSVKYSGRAPRGTALIRVYIGDHLGADPTLWSDDELDRVGRDALRRWVGARGEPSLIRFSRAHRAMPQYDVGHLDRVERIERLISAHPGLFFGGNACHGVGIPDAVRHASDVASRIARLAAAGPSAHDSEETEANP